MSIREDALIFPCAGEQLLGIVSRSAQPLEHGVLIVVGGPQYRVGSHRQFLLLSRRLAADGYPALRFDYRGMGDSSGSARAFEMVSEDIAAAIDAFMQACPTVRRVVLWGLCDAASAALLYVQSQQDPRIAGLVLLNPWVRSEASLAQTHIKHYYGRRLLQRAFWGKLLSGKLHPLESLREFLKNFTQARGKAVPAQDKSRSFQDRMAEGLRQFSGGVLLILSGQDYTAKEFLAFAEANAGWSDLADTAKVSRLNVDAADHTFSSDASRRLVESATLDWLARLRAH